MLLPPSSSSPVSTLIPYALMTLLVRVQEGSRKGMSHDTSDAPMRQGR